MDKEKVKQIKKENQNIRETLNRLEKNQEDIALNSGEYIDYYSFLQGFDYVIREFRIALNKN